MQVLPAAYNGSADTPHYPDFSEWLPRDTPCLGELGGGAGPVLWGWVSELCTDAFTWGARGAANFLCEHVVGDGPP